MFYLSVEEVSKKLGLDQSTVQKMCEKGKFHHAYQSDNGDWRIPENNFVTTKEQDEKADEILRKIDIKNRKVMKDTEVEYMDAQLVADYYEVPIDKVVSWINKGHLSGKETKGKYVVPKEEFDFLKSKRDNDTTEEEIKKILGSDYMDDWDMDK